MTVGSAPIKLRVNWLSSSSSDKDDDGDSAKLNDLLRVVVEVSSLSRSNMRDRGELSFCYDFVITQVVIRQSFDLTFIFGLRYKVYSGKAKLQF